MNNSRDERIEKLRAEIEGLTKQQLAIAETLKEKKEKLRELETDFSIGEHIVFNGKNAIVSSFSGIGFKIKYITKKGVPSLVEHYIFKDDMAKVKKIEVKNDHKI